MGKGYIISHKGDGLYDVRLTYAYRSRITAKLATYTGQISELDIKIAAETDVNKKAILKLQRASAQKLYDYYSTKMPADPTVEAWCADLTEDLTYGTVVGTMEIPGEKVTVLVRPAYNNRAVYSTPRDGTLMPAIAGTPHQVIFNWMILPGWQRHKPIYRIGTIIDGTIDRDLHTCSVCLEPAYSSQQNLPAIDSTGISECGSTTPLGLYAAAAMADYCSRYPSAGLCTNTEDGTPLELSDAQLADLQAVNNYVNTNYGNKTDVSGFRVGESWDELAPGESGDCEDKALTKAKRLIENYGWNPRDLKMAVGFTETGEGHATLAVRTTNRGILILDNRNSAVVQHTRLSYKFDSIALQKDKWKNFTRQLDAVPIEYMNCNSWAFGAGDRVVIQFTDQDWSKPKVIGFVEDPEPCDFTIWRHGVVGTSLSGVWGYSVNLETWTRGQNTPEPSIIYAVDAISFDDSGNQWIFGGGTAYPECPDKNFRKNCLKFNTVSEGYTARLDHPEPGRPVGQSSWYISNGSFLIGGLLVDICYVLDPENPEAPPEDALNEKTCKDDNDFFNDSLNTWTAKQSFPHTVEYAFDFGIGAIGYVGGGDLVDVEVFDSFYKYDPTLDSWASRQDLSRGLTFAQGATVSGKGYHLMGYADSQATGDSSASSGGITGLWHTSWLNEYDPIGDVWSYKSQALYRRPFAGAVGINGEIWSQYLGLLQKYNPLTESWSEYSYMVNPGGYDHSRLAR